MKYLIIILLFFIGCENKPQNQREKQILKEDILPHKKVIVKDEKEIPSIKIENLIFKKLNNSKLEYNFQNNIILLFVNNNKFSSIQIEELNNSNQKFYIIKNNIIKRFFDIKTYPTMIITKDNNHSKKYEGFIPNTILKYEIKD